MPCFGLDLEAQLSGETDSAKEAEPILRESRSRITDGTDSFGIEIGTPLYKVQNLVLQRIEKHAVNGEITPFGVFF